MLNNAEALLRPLTEGQPYTKRLVRTQPPVRHWDLAGVLCACFERVLIIVGVTLDGTGWLGVVWRSTFDT